MGFQGVNEKKEFYFAPFKLKSLEKQNESIREFDRVWFFFGSLASEAST
jgi:hypothetical protein